MKVEIASVKDCTGKFVDVIKELGDFYNALKLKNPSLEFKPCTSRKYLGDDGAVVAYGLLDVVDVDNHEFNLGKIMFWNDKYTVVSRLLINNKFSCWNREEYHSKSSVHMKKVIKPALESLLPLTVDEIKEASLNRCSVTKDLKNIRENIQNKVKSNQDKIHYEDLFEELINMDRVGYSPKNQKVAKAIKFAVENEAEYIEDHNYFPDAYFVYIKTNGSVSVVDHGKVNNTTIEYPDVEGLPEEIRGKLMVLMLSPNDTFIRDIGKKDKENMYWILTQAGVNS